MRCLQNTLFTGVRRIGAGHTAAAVERVPDRVPQPRKQGIRVSHLSLVVDRRETIPQPSTITSYHHIIIITPKSISQMLLLQRVLDADRGRGHAGERGRQFPLVPTDVPEVG